MNFLKNKKNYVIKKISKMKSKASGNFFCFFLARAADNLKKIEIGFFFTFLRILLFKSKELVQISSLCLTNLLKKVYKTAKI